MEKLRQLINDNIFNRNSTNKITNVSHANAMYGIGAGVSVKAYGATGDGTTDDTAAINAAIVDVQSRLGGILFFPAGVYNIAGNLVVTPPFSGTYDGMLTAPMRWIGEGMAASGNINGYNFLTQSNVSVLQPKGGTVLKFTGTGTGLYLKYYGYFSSEGISYYNNGSLAKIIHVTGTTVHLIGNYFYSVSDCIAVKCGGSTEAYAATGTVPDDGGFQGYGSVIDRNFFFGQLVAVQMTTFANNICVTNNTVWRGSGTATPAFLNAGLDAPFIFDAGVFAGATEPCVGGYIAGNLLELSNYKYGIRLGYTMRFTLVGNSGYDPGPNTLSVVYFGARSRVNSIIPGFSPALMASTVIDYIDQSTAKDNRIINGTLIP